MWLLRFSMNMTDGGAQRRCRTSYRTSRDLPRIRQLLLSRSYVPTYMPMNAKPQGSEKLTNLADDNWTSVAGCLSFLSCVESRLVLGCIKRSRVPELDREMLLKRAPQSCVICIRQGNRGQKHVQRIFTGSHFSRQLPATIQSGLHVSMNSRPLRWPRRRSRLRVLQIGYNVARTHKMTRSQTQRRARTLSERKHVDRLDARPEARTLSESNEVAPTRSRAKSSLQPSDRSLLSSVEVKRPRQIRVRFGCIGRRNADISAENEVRQCCMNLTLGR